MSNDITFSIIKPNAVKSGNTGAILAMINEAGFEISALKMVQLTQNQAENFYDIHKSRPFFRELVEFMISGPVVVMILKCSDAVAEFRRLMGATNPENAEEGTIRKKYAESVTKNAIHGSDSYENAMRESDFFFSQTERFY
jgi:nucleoside-diphosphate kinase